VIGAPGCRWGRRWGLWLWVAGASLLLPAGCGGPHDAGADAGPKSCPIGDLKAPAEIEIVHLDAKDAVIQTQPMAQVPLLPPPQGGWIVLLGARARNIDGCRVTLTTALVDGCDQQILQIDKRPTRLEPGADGWGTSTVTMFGNLPVCPDLTAKRDLHDVPYDVKVVIEDTGGQKASATLTVVPICPPGDALCMCQCDRDYVIGSSCNPPPTGGHGTCPSPGR
jgi:hypothetical protein